MKFVATVLIAILISTTTPKLCVILRRKNNMYINPFLAGVLATVFAEVSAMFIASLVIMFKRGKNHD